MHPRPHSDRWWNQVFLTPKNLLLSFHHTASMNLTTIYLCTLDGISFFKHHVTHLTPYGQIKCQVFLHVCTCMFVSTHTYRDSATVVAAIDCLDSNSARLFVYPY